MLKLNLFGKLGISLAILSTLGIVGINNTQDLKAQDVINDTDIEAVADDEVNNLIGQTITVRGEVEDVEPGLSFTLNEEGFLEGDSVLVLNVSGGMLPEMPDEVLELQVTGELNKLVIGDIESRYGLNLNPDVYLDYENTPIILAESIALSPEVADITGKPENFYGKEVAVEAEVEEILADFAFTLDEEQLIGGEDLLVVDVTGEPIPADDERVVVTGMIRPFVKAEFERDYDLTWDLNMMQEIEAEYSNKPVLVVDAIYPIAE